MVIGTKLLDEATSEAAVLLMRPETPRTLRLSVRTTGAPTDFIIPPLMPGELKLLRWKEDNILVQNLVGRIGLTDRTSRVLRRYTKDL